MLLAIEAGNINVVFAIYYDAERRGLWRGSPEHTRQVRSRKKVFGTSRLALFHTAATKMVEHIEPSLTLSGIGKIWRRNCGVA